MTSETPDPPTTRFSDWVSRTYCPVCEQERGTGSCRHVEPQVAAGAPDPPTTYFGRPNPAPAGEPPPWSFTTGPGRAGYDRPNNIPWDGQPQQSYLPPPQAPAPKKRSWFRRHKVFTGLLVLVAVLLVAGGISVATAPKPVPAGSKALPVVTPRPPAPKLSATSAPTTTPAAYTPKAADFTLALRVTRKVCFGDAGCNVDFKVDFKDIAARVPDDSSFSVTFAVRGGEDGPLVDTIDVVDGNYNPVDESISTASSGAKLTVKVTDVSES
jgi:hypothetical protein